MKIHLEDLPKRRTYLKFTDHFAKEFFGACENNFDIYHILKRLNYKQARGQWRQYKNQNSFYPLFFVKELSDALKKISNKFSMYNIEKYVKFIKVGRFGRGSRGKVICDPKFPINFNKPISRIMAHLLCDGDFGYGRIRYTNSDINLISSFIKDLKVFGDVDIHRSYDSGAYRVFVPGIVGFILIRFGFDKDNFDFISKSSKENKTAFLQVVYDDEGSVSFNIKRINMSSKNKEFVHVIRTLLLNFGILTSLVRKTHTYSTKKGRIISMYSIYI